MKVIVPSLMILALLLAPAYGQVTSGPSQNAVSPAQTASTGEVQEPEMHFPVLRTLGGLGLVVCAMIAVYFAAKKFAPRYFAKAGSERNLKVIETLAMGDHRSISLIEVGDNRFLVGNTPHQINLLAALPEPISLVSEPNTLPANPKDTLQNESRASFRNLFEVEKKRSSQYMQNPLPEDIRTKMRQLREALER
jgi:flagellar biosynthetic protein FliO